MAIFGCSHKRVTFPQTPRPGTVPAAETTGTYLVCLDCGAELPYDWSEMKIVAASA